MWLWQDRCIHSTLNLGVFVFIWLYLIGLLIWEAQDKHLLYWKNSIWDLLPQRLLQHKSIFWEENSVHVKFHSSDLKSRTCIWSIWKNRTNFVSWVIEHPKFLPATQCHVPPKSSSHFFFIKVATSYVKICRQIRRRRIKGSVHCQIMITFSTWCLSRASLTRTKTFSDRSAGMSALNILICRSRQIWGTFITGYFFVVDNWL